MFKWLKEFQINVKKLREWRLKTFPNLNTTISVSKVKQSLEKLMDGADYIKVYRNLFSSASRPQIYPYGIEVEGFVRVPPFWAMFVDLLYYTELEGSIKLKKIEKRRTQEFEKVTVPRAFTDLGFEEVSGQKEIKNGNIIFEIDSYVWDRLDTLWVVESKSKSLHKRFMESYDSWFNLCREWVERPKRRLSYPQVIEIVCQNYKNYQKRGILPKNWEIKEVKGLIVSQIPPFEEEYLGIAILWYKELAEFFG